MNSSYEQRSDLRETRDNRGEGREIRETRKGS